MTGSLNPWTVFRCRFRWNSALKAHSHPGARHANGRSGSLRTFFAPETGDPEVLLLLPVSPPRSLLLGLLVGVLVLMVELLLPLDRCLVLAPVLLLLLPLAETGPPLAR